MCSSYQLPRALKCRMLRGPDATIEQSFNALRNLLRRLNKGLIVVNSEDASASLLLTRHGVVGLYGSMCVTEY